MISSYHEFILVTDILSCYDRMMMKEMKKETLLEYTFVATMTSGLIKKSKGTLDYDSRWKSRSH